MSNTTSRETGGIPFRLRISNAIRDTFIFLLSLIVFLKLLSYVLPSSRYPPGASTPVLIPAGRRTAYETLGVGPCDDYYTIGSAWRQRSEETHPDRIGHQNFEEYYLIQSAYYEIFNDPHRCMYDHHRGIRGLWADRHSECARIWLSYTRFQVQMREKERAREAKAPQEKAHRERTRERDEVFADEAYYGPWNVLDEKDLKDWTSKDRTAGYATSGGHPRPSWHRETGETFEEWWAPKHHTVTWVEEVLPEKAEHVEEEQVKDQAKDQAKDRGKEQGKEQEQRSDKDNGLPESRDDEPAATPPKANIWSTARDFGLGFVTGELTARATGWVVGGLYRLGGRFYEYYSDPERRQ